MIPNKQPHKPNPEGRILNMKPLEVINIIDRRAQPIPYRGPLRKARQPLKWAILAAMAAYIVDLVVMGLQDNPLGQTEWILGALLVAGLIWLFATRTRYEMIPKRLTVSFWPHHLVMEREDSRANGRVHKRVDKIPYSGIEKMRLQTRYGRLEIFGIVSCEIFRHRKDGVLEERPSYKKTAKAAVSALLKEHNSPDRVEQLLATLERYTGRKVDRYDPTSR